MIKITEGKYKSIQAVADENGLIRAAAMDQRGSLRKSIAQAKGVAPEEISREEMQEFKAEVTRALTPYASAILLDPEFGLPAAKVRAKNSGLLLAYESTGYDTTLPGRIPTLIPGYTIRKLKEDGGNCVKFLLYYTQFEKPEVNERKKEIIKQVAAECRKEDIAFFMEPVGYDVSGQKPEKGVEYAKIKPEIVIHTIEEFTKDEYGIDVLKVEIPVNLKYTEGSKSYNGKDKAYTLDQAMNYYRKAADTSTKPFIYLSAGVSEEEFRENLIVAGQAGVNYAGVLCGRATWQDGVPIYAKNGPKALAAWLRDKGVQNIQALNQILTKTAKPWYSKYGGRKNIEVVKSSEVKV